MKKQCMLCGAVFGVDWGSRILCDHPESMTSEVDKKLELSERKQILAVRAKLEGKEYKHIIHEGR